jgi:hypothetical protein
MNEILALSKGNPGAMMFLMNAPQHVVQAIEKTSIRGADIYVLHSDLCNRNMQKVEKLLKNCPIDVLQDACSRQDYSGQTLVAPYLV